MATASRKPSTAGAQTKFMVPGFRTQRSSGSDVSLQKFRDTVIGKRWMCSDSERSTLQRERAITEGKCCDHGCGVVRFCKLGKFIC